MTVKHESSPESGKGREEGERGEDRSEVIRQKMDGDRGTR